LRIGFAKRLTSREPERSIGIRRLVERLLREPNAGAPKAQIPMRSVGDVQCAEGADSARSEGDGYVRGRGAES